MTDALEKLRQWLQTYPRIAAMRSLKVDYFEPDPDNGSLAPTGLVEISRTEDILGNVTVENQYNFALYFVLAKAPGDDVGATANAKLLLDLQNWVQEQSIRHLVPVFGDDPRRETVKAQNGAIWEADGDGIARYMVQLSINFIKHYEVM
ncbi:MAG: hypothetical protein IJW45_00730 [Oscillospiraceae bacterium]|nr:hypothetical protein [Oscillospiraceae bacterium]